MVTDLLGDGSPPEIVQSITLVGLAEQRVKRLVRPGRGGAIRRNREGGNVRHLLPLIVARGRLVQHVAVLELLGDSLQHGQRLAKVHRYGYLGQVLANAVLHDAPQIERVVWSRSDRRAPLFHRSSHALQQTQVAGRLSLVRMRGGFFGGRDSSHHVRRGGRFFGRLFLVLVHSDLYCLLILLVVVVLGLLQVELGDAARVAVMQTRGLLTWQGDAEVDLFDRVVEFVIVQRLVLVVLVIVVVIGRVLIYQIKKCNYY
jgi:hypothetical protein